MIKHLGEELVPFATSHFAREPEWPLAGEPVTVRCRIDQNTAIPHLTLEVDGEQRTLLPDEQDDRFFTFLLGSFAAGRHIRYCISAGNEQTPWFTFHIGTRETITRPLSIIRQNDTLVVVLAADVVLTLTGGDSLTMILTQQSVSGISVESASLSLPQSFTLTCDATCIWKLNRLSDTLCQCVDYTLRRDPDGRVTAVSLHMAMESQYVLGSGERFDSVNMRGQSTNGRVVEKFTHQGAQSYLPIPFFMTEQGFGWYRKSSIPVEMRFEAITVLSQETEGALLTHDVITFGTPAFLLSDFVSRTGNPVLPPEWAFGLWISAHGWRDDQEVDRQLAALKRYDYPATAMVLEQWSDERTFYQWHPDHWRDPQAMVRRVQAAGLHLILWQIPIVKHEWDGEPGEALTADAQEAIQKGYVIQSADGSPYRVTERWFHHSMMLDFTNPEAVRWWFGKRKYLLDMGIEGFKTDGGEFLFEKTARLHDGTSGLAAHNLYPMQYLHAYHDFMRDARVDGVLFSRAGYLGAQTCPIHWAGDQASSFSELQACIRAGLSAGLSGVLFWSFDIGGFSGPIPSVELYLRATAMGCFCPVMQWHSEPRSGQFEKGEGEAYNNERSPWNLAEKWGDERVLTIACAFARLREKLRPYLWQEAIHCSQSARPLMAHMCLDWPDDPLAWAADDQYMLGRALLVAPLLHEGMDTRALYLPQGEWEDYFTGEQHSGGRTITVTCPLDRIPVYRRRASRATHQH